MSHDRIIPVYAEPGAEFIDDNDGNRVKIGTHVMEENGVRYLVQKSNDVGFGKLTMANGGQVPFLRMKAEESPNALIYPMTPAELRHIGQSMVEMADELESAAAAAVPEAFRRKPVA